MGPRDSAVVISSSEGRLESDLGLAEEQLQWRNWGDARKQHDGRCLDKGAWCCSWIEGQSRISKRADQNSMESTTDLHWIPLASNTEDLWHLNTGSGTRGTLHMANSSPDLNRGVVRITVIMSLATSLFLVAILRCSTIVGFLIGGKHCYQGRQVIRGIQQKCNAKGKAHNIRFSAWFQA